MTHRVAVLGTGIHTRDTLRRCGFDDVVVLDTVTDRSFDGVDHIWTLRTADGTEHRARIVVDEQPTEHTPAPYLGVAVHGMPNHFLLTGPDRVGQARYIAECLRVMDRRASNRIEVRHSTQRVFNDRARGGGVVPWRRLAKKIPSAFHLSSHPGLDDEIYDGPATVGVGGGRTVAVRARLTGHLDPVDGRFHWRGTLFEMPDLSPGAQTVTVGIGDRSAEGRITERTPWGHTVAGVGAPPFPLDDVEVAVPAR